MDHFSAGYSHHVELDLALRGFLLIRLEKNPSECDFSPPETQHSVMSSIMVF
jgi:hypothetical protein